MYKKLGASGIFAFSGKTIDKLPDKLQILSKYESNFNGGCYSISGFSPITSLKITSDNCSQLLVPPFPSQSVTYKITNSF